MKTPLTGAFCCQCTFSGIKNAVNDTVTPYTEFSTLIALPHPQTFISDIKGKAISN